MALGNLLASVLELFLPRACAGCAAPLQGKRALCCDCDRRLVRLPRTACQRCQAPGGDGVCAPCARTVSLLDACVAEVAFAGEGAAWVRRFKYPRAGFGGLDPRPAAVMTALLCDAARRLPPLPRPRLLLPVPLHPRRLRLRGFHPAGELARSLGRELRIRMDPSFLKRVRDTPSQTGLDRRERRLNVADAFWARRDVPLPRCVCLVDDVVTTGSTLSEAARELRRAGAKRVLAVCVARTPFALAG